MGSQSLLRNREQTEKKSDLQSRCSKRTVPLISSFACLHNVESLCQSAIVLCAYSVRKRDNLVFICVKVTGDNGAGYNKFLSLINASESQKGEVCFVIRYVLNFTPHQSGSLLQSSISHSSLSSRCTNIPASNEHHFITEPGMQVQPYFLTCNFYQSVQN